MVITGKSSMASFLTSCKLAIDLIFKPNCLAGSAGACGVLTDFSGDFLLSLVGLALVSKKLLVGSMLNSRPGTEASLTGVGCCCSPAMFCPP